MEVPVGNGEINKTRENKSWWDKRSLCQRNLIVGVVTAGILAGMIIPLCINSSGHSDSNHEEPATDSSTSVIIIGAGPAGIAAAAQLLENNITNVVILEAENRIGGRIQSVHFGDNIVDLGAEWCHGQQGNLVYELASPLNLLEIDPIDNIVFYHSSQKYLDRGFVKQIYEIIDEIYNEPKDGADTSLGEYILQRFNSTINENYGNYPKKITLAHDILNAAHLGILTEEGAFSWFDVAAQTDFKISPGPLNLSWKGRGYKTILDILTKKYPDPTNELPVHEKVIFKKDAVKITLGETLEITCDDNTTYAADHVIWTPSLGVLKHRYKNLFDPELPHEKINAIESIGIAAVMKVFYYFPQRWWPKHVNVFNFFWSKRDTQNLWKEFPYGSKTQGRSWLSFLPAILTYQYNPNVLCAWFGGEGVPSIEKLQDEIIINGTMFLLNKFLGHQFHNITRPQKIIREKWYMNDHFRGTYSYDTLESLAAAVPQREVLSEPLKTAEEKPVILFAGEATNPIHFGTVHGAIETGRREADRIIDYYKEI